MSSYINNTHDLQLKSLVCFTHEDQWLRQECQGPFKVIKRSVDPSSYLLENTLGDSIEYNSKEHTLDRLRLPGGYRIKIIRGEWTDMMLINTRATMKRMCEVFSVRIGNAPGDIKYQAESSKAIELVGVASISLSDSDRGRLGRMGISFKRNAAGKVEMQYPANRFTHFEQTKPECQIRFYLKSDHHNIIRIRAPKSGASNCLVDYALNEEEQKIAEGVKSPALQRTIASVKIPRELGARLLGKDWEALAKFGIAFESHGAHQKILYCDYYICALDLSQRHINFYFKDSLKKAIDIFTKAIPATDAVTAVSHSKVEYVGRRQAEIKDEAESLIARAYYIPKPVAKVLIRNSYCIEYTPSLEGVRAKVPSRATEIPSFINGSLSIEKRAQFAKLGILFFNNLAICPNKIDCVIKLSGSTHEILFNYKGNPVISIHAKNGEFFKVIDYPVPEEYRMEVKHQASSKKKIELKGLLNNLQPYEKQHLAKIGIIVNDDAIAYSEDLFLYAIEDVKDISILSFYLKGSAEHAITIYVRTDPQRRGESIFLRTQDFPPSIASCLSNQDRLKLSDLHITFERDEEHGHTIVYPDRFICSVKEIAWNKYLISFSLRHNNEHVITIEAHVYGGTRYVDEEERKREASSRPQAEAKSQTESGAKTDGPEAAAVSLPKAKFSNKKTVIIPRDIAKHLSEEDRLRLSKMGISFEDHRLEYFEDKFNCDINYPAFDKVLFRFRFPNVDKDIVTISAAEYGGKCGAAVAYAELTPEEQSRAEEN